MNRRGYGRAEGCVQNELAAVGKDEHFCLRRVWHVRAWVLVCRKHFNLLQGGPRAALRSAFYLLRGEK